MDTRNRTEFKEMAFVHGLVALFVFAAFASVVAVDLVSKLS